LAALTVAAGFLVLACGLNLTATPDVDAGVGADGGVIPNGPDALAPMDAQPIPSVLDAASDAQTDPGPPSNCAVRQSVPLSLAVAKIVTPPTVDGLANDWQGAAWQPISYPSLDSTLTGSICADFAVRWSPGALYVYARVLDLEHTGRDAGALPEAAFLNDGVEMFAGPDPTPDNAKYTANHLHYAVNWNGTRARRGASDCSFDITPLLDAEVLSARQDFAWGYAVEMQLVSTLKTGKYAFDIAAINGTGTAQTAYRTWAPVSTSAPRGCCGNGANDRGPYCSTKVWGTLDLK
jgi:hypothetical protein